MYKLTIVSGPNRGQSFSINDGENSVGRVDSNAVMLKSSKISKKHCVLVASDGELVLRDNGSSNGTFVNGVLTKEKKVKHGDRISVGEYVLEVVQPLERPVVLSQGFGGVVVPFPGGAPASYQHQAGAASAGASEVSNAPVIPTDLKGKALYYFEQFVMPIFYNMNFRTQWRMIAIGVFGAFVITNLVLSVQPLLEQSHKAVINEVKRRATFMARQIAERNGPALAAQAESKTDIGSIENASGVHLAVLTDLENRIIAPPAQSNSYLAAGPEALFATKAREAFRNGLEAGLVQATPDLVIAAEPVKVLNPAQARNTTVAMAIVSIDTTLITMGMGELGMVYSETMVVTVLLAILTLMILYRLTLKPLEILSDDVDRALKGDLSQVTHEYQIEELNPLWDLLNSTIQRISRNSGEGVSNGGGSTQFNIDEFSGPFRMLGEVAKFGIVVCDSNRKIVAMNPVFEEISGIRAEGALGQELPAVARDQAFIAMTNDLFDRVPPGGEGASEDFDFSGVTYKVHVAVAGSPGSIKCYFLVAVKGDA